MDGSFVASAITLARNVKEDKGVIQTSSLDLTEVLEKKFSEGALKDLDKESALSYLRGSLSWSVTESGKEVQDVKGLTVKVVSIEVVPPTSASEFPEWKGGFEEDDGGSTAS